LEGVARVSKHELLLDIIPAKDSELNKTDVLSARWTSSLTPPSSGDYVLIYEGEGTVKVYLNGKAVIDKQVYAAHPATATLPLLAGKKYDLRIESAGINKQVRQRLAWRLPSGENSLTPEKAAKNADMAIVFIRDDGGAEGRDRKTLALNSVREQMIAGIAKANPNTVLILGSSAPLLLGNVSRQVKALLNVWIAGQGEAQAITDILSGKVNPSGKTSLTFFADERQLPDLDDYKVKNGRTYQYFRGDVLYPFGFGMSYTTYAYSRPSLQQASLTLADTIKVSVKITNKGKYDGEEVAQCYVSSPSWKTGGLKQKLVGFNRIFLKKGESGVLEFQVPVSELNRWDAGQHRWNSQPGKYRISIVPHSGIENAISFTVRQR
jgi:beta-glucosidase